jgi:hypothetical protein
VATRPNKRLRWVASAFRVRWLWVAVAAIHGPALSSSFRTFVESGLDPSRVWGFVALALSMLFFLAKIWGVKALEFAGGPRAVLTIAIALVLIHAGAIETYLQFEAVPKAVPVAATTVLAAGLTSVQRTVEAVVSRSDQTAKRRRRLMPAFGATALGPPARRQAALVACLCAPRAPPF